MKRAVLAALAALSLTGCSHGSPSVFPSKSTSPGHEIIQGGPPPTDWEVFGVPQTLTQNSRMTVGPDSQIWMAGYGNVFHFHVKTGKIETLSGFDTATGDITTGPDGNLWMCGTDTVTKLTTGGVATVYPTSDLCTGIVAGSDGAMWYAADHFVGRITTDGTVTDISLPQFEQTVDIVSGSDGNVWIPETITDRNGYEAIAKIDVQTRAMTEFKIPRSGRDGLDLIFADKHGNLYAVDGDNTVFRLTPPSTWRKFTPNLGPPLKPGDLTGLYFASSSGGFKWTFSGHNVISYGLPSDPSGFPAYSSVLGPDHNIWFWSGPKMSIFINRVLSTSPASATIGVGGSQPFIISESGCQNCVWRAVSLNPSVASVSPVNGEAFTVTGIASGNATVVVSDRAQNVFDVSIIVE